LDHVAFNCKDIDESVCFYESNSGGKSTVMRLARERRKMEVCRRAKDRVTPR
jgi:catechol 2,3-dioxygenase-like lactoylglutathione lyase family enzyme